MENQSAKRRKKVDDDGDGDDRISRLPEPLLLHILCFLSQKKAVQTCVLSKSWRHLGSTRPVIRLRRTCGCHYYHNDTNFVCEHCFGGNTEAFLSVLDNAFQTYRDQNLLLQDLRLESLDADCQWTSSALAKWIPVFVKPNTRLTTLCLSVMFRLTYFELPWVVFKAESLENIYLHGCNIYSTTDNAVLKNLQKLSLAVVRIKAGTLEKIIAASPLLQYVQLHRCRGLKIVSITNENRRLNYFKFIATDQPMRGEWNVIEIDSPTLQSIHIERCLNLNLSRDNYFSQLKSLYLSDVQLMRAPSFDNFSCNFPLLEEFTLSSCYVCRDIKLLFSHSLKYLAIELSSWIKVDIDAPNILCFVFSGRILPRTFSLSTASREWKSYITLQNYPHDYKDALLRLLELKKMVKALSQSQISVTLCGALRYEMKHIIGWGFNDHVAVEHLRIDLIKFLSFNSSFDFSNDLFPYFLNDLFRIFRPRYVKALRDLHSDEDGVNEVTECLWTTLIHEREKKEKKKYCWQQHLLKEVSIEASDEKGEVWQHIEGKYLPERASANNRKKTRFRLKWRD